MQKTIKNLLVVAFLVGAPFLRAQSSNEVWFVTWNGQPTPSSDVSVQSMASAGNATAITAGMASYFVSQTNFSSFNSPYGIVVDPVMGKVYVLDNNAQGVAPEYIYSFNLTGTSAQIAASGQIIYTMPISQADVNANLYPLVSGIALDSVNHYLYFSQIDVTTSTNSFIGRLNLATSSSSDVLSSGTNNPILQTYYTGQIPSQGSVTIAIDTTNIYIGVINGPNANDGVYTAPISGNGTFSEIITNSFGDATFANGFVSGVASYPQSNLVYYLTFNAGVVNNNYNVSQNAVWVYNTVSNTKTKIGSGYPGYPNNIALDTANSRYYFTVGQDGTGSIVSTNYQAIYTGTLGSTNAPTLFYTPLLSGQDIAGQLNAGKVSLQGIYVQDIPANTSPVAGFVAAPTNGFALLNITFTDASTGSITNRIWSFGDGNSVTTNSNASVNHTYGIPGTSTVTLIANGSGGSSTNTKVGYIIVSPKPVFSSTTRLASGVGLALNGNNGPVGLQYRILTSTNMALPLGSWTPVYTNVFAPNGSYGYTNSSLAGKASYFILASP
jgi:PKD repeat protein